MNDSDSEPRQQQHCKICLDTLMFEIGCLDTLKFKICLDTLMFEISCLDTLKFKISRLYRRLVVVVVPSGGGTRNGLTLLTASSEQL